jgi:hypothetical protein
MKYILGHVNYIREAVTDTRVICDKCGWNWAIVDGGDDLYMCHKCGNDNTPSNTLK